MSDLYKEALADAAKIREIAEEDARNTILEKISPYIKQMIAKEASRSFLIEQEEPSAAMPVVEPTPEVAAPEVPSMSSAEDMPIAPSGKSDLDVVDIPVPKGDGSLTLSFKDLFNPETAGSIVNPTDIGAESSTSIATATPPTDLTAPPAALEAPSVEPVAEPSAAEAGPTPAPETAGAAAEEPVAPAPTSPVAAPIAEAKTVKQFERQLAEMAVKIERMYNTKVSALTQDAYKTKLFSLLEQLDKLAANKAITPRQAQLNENRLEFLFLHLKEANLNNSYKTKDKDTTMTTLKEFAAKLFESADEERLAQDSQSTGETGVAVHKKATDHAQSVDGVQADLFAGGSKTVETRHAAAGSVDAEELEGLDPESGAWEKALMEEVEAALRDELDAHEVPEAGEVPPAVEKSGYFEISEAALKEAIANIRKESASKKAKLREQAEGMEEDLVLSVELPADVEEELAGQDLDVDVMFSGEEEEGEEMEMGDEEEVVDLDMSDAGEEEGEEEMGSEEKDVLLADEEAMEEMAVPMKESRNVRKALLEARVREVKARRLAEAKRAEAATLKKEMAETNLFLSKLVYLNKFLVREDLSRKVKQQIVEHLDRASTIQEAKEIYGKIVKKLDEAAAAQTAPVVGSAPSKRTTAGSATLNESATRAASTNGSEPVIGTFEKWQILANIKKNG
jgi:hypothetical protein